MKFRHAREEEKELLISCYRSALGSPFCTWNKEYPAMENIEQDLAEDNLFVLEDMDIIGVISIETDEEMADMSCWKVRDNTAEISRVLIRPEYQRKGYARILVEHVLEEMKKRGIRAAHLAVAEINLPARRTYERLGFVILGESDMYGSHYLLAEKVL